MKKSTRKILWIWSFALALFVCVAATGVVISNLLNSFQMNDDGAISLLGGQVERVSGTEDGDQKEDLLLPKPAPKANPSKRSAPETIDVARPMSTASFVSAPIRSPMLQEDAGFEASDDKTVWTTNTKVEIFRVSYENGEQVVTVNGSNGQKVIAPGTENSYTFKLKNTGTVALDYTLDVDAYFTPADIKIPISGRLNRYDGQWIVGTSEDYAPASALDDAKDDETLAAGKYTYYTLDWVWPFESGDDALDTELGNLATKEDLVFTIVIKTTATESDEGGGGITPPQTGEHTDLWIVLAVSSFAMMIFLLFYQNKEKRRDSAEANTN